MPTATDLTLAPVSAGRHSSADNADWTGVWVAVGFADQLTEPGAVLPATVGYHAAHVRRTEDGLAGAINARPFGGCMSIPVHCGSTRNIRCPHRACAFSEDGGVLDSTTDPGGRARAEFVGDGRRTVEIPVTQWGSVVFVNVTTMAPAPLDVPGTPAPGPVVALDIRLVSGNWLTSVRREAHVVADALGVAEVVAVPPNVALVRAGSATVALVGRPAGATRSTILSALLGGDVDGADGQRVMWAISPRA
jgi:nitrite reductase/ring-hydroxylating ferredoxin subunit